MTERTKREALEELEARGLLGLDAKHELARLRTLDDPHLEIKKEAWVEGYVAAMAKYVPNAVPIWRKDENPYHVEHGWSGAGEGDAG